jgi:hypothetical protein
LENIAASPLDFQSEAHTPLKESRVTAVTLVNCLICAFWRHDYDKLSARAKSGRLGGNFGGLNFRSEQIAA